MNKKSNAYYKYLHTSEVGEDTAKSHREITAEYFWNIFKSFGCRTVLDVGCGVGFFIGRAGQGIHAFGVDADVRIAGCCVKNGQMAAAGNAASLPVRSGAVDGIMCGHLLEHTGEPDNVFAEFNRILKQEGVLIVRVPPFNASFYDDWTHVRPFTKKTLARLASVSGFRPLRIFYYHYDIPFRHWQNPLFKTLNRIRQLPGIRLMINSVIKLFGLPPKEIVMIARKSAAV